MEKNYLINDICDVGSSKRIYLSEYQDTGIPFYRGKEIIEKDSNKDISNELFISQERYSEIKEKFGVPKVGDILMTAVGTIGVSWYVDESNFYFKDGNLIWFKNFKENIVNSRYLYYIFKSKVFSEQIKNISIGSTQKAITIEQVKKIRLNLPEISVQNRIVKILDNIDNKIKLNNEINNNLEEQLRLFFEENILKKLDDENTYKCSLYDQFDVIDNRGKTPPLVEYSKYPIIDVKVLSGAERVINYNNCLKYVDKETYDTFFRSGHPQLYDTLLSTVGSLAELKIYLENIGTIAQNVVALRPKNDYPLFMYQYILSLRQRLTSYDIGSVQPSIKVTQFMKEIIKMPNDKELIYKFENLAKANTLKMKNLMMENRYLEQLRGTLLPKLMNGEIDLDNIEI